MTPERIAELRELWATTGWPAHRTDAANMRLVIVEALDEIERLRTEVADLRLKHRITSEGVAELRLVNKDAADWLEEYCAGLRDRGDD